MSFVEDDHVVETFPANAADEAFRVSILPRRVWRGDHLFDLHPFHSTAELFAIGLISIPEQETWRGVLGECFDNLPRGPFRGGVFGHIEVHDLPPIMQENDETI